MPVRQALAEADLKPVIDRLLAESSLFQGIAPDALASLLRQVGHRLHLAPGEALLTEGEPAEALCFIEQGQFEVRKRSDAAPAPAGAPGDDGHCIGQVGPGEMVGEVALFDRGGRSATVRARSAAQVLLLRIGELDALAGPPLPPAAQMRLNLAREMAGRVRHSTANAVRHLEDSLRESQQREAMGRFMCRVLIGTCLYMFAMVLMQPLKALLPDTAVLSVPLLLAFAFGLYLTIRTSPFPLSAHGFTLAGWRPALAEAVLFSLPVLAGVVALKWLLLQTSPALAGRQLFDLYRPSGLGPGATLAVLAAYASFVPVQEMVARSGIQSSLMLFLRPPGRVPMAVFMSALLFSATHLHTGIQFAALVFPMGLFWGWLYARRPTLVGVVCSHLLIGIFAVFVVSFPFS